MSKKITPTSPERVLSELKRFKKGRTCVDLFLATGVWHVTDAILKLRKAGFAITTKMTTSNNRHGEKVRYAKYILE